MTNTIAFVSIKGGVGKTTIALETACSLVNHFKKKVLLIDGNFSAPNLGLYLNLTSDLTLHDALNGTPLHNTIYESHGIDIIPSSMHYNNPVDTFQLKKILEKFKRRYDYIIIDSSPNYEELRPVINSADKIFVITSPDHVTLETSLKAAELAKEQDTPIEGIIINKIRSPKYEFNLKEIEEYSSIPVIARIKENKKIAIAIYNKIPISLEYPNNHISKEIRNLASALCGKSEIKHSLLMKIFIPSFLGKEKINREILRQKFYESQFSDIKEKP